MDPDPDAISPETMEALLKTDIGQQRLAEKYAEGYEVGLEQGYKEGLELARQEVGHRVYLKLIKFMSEEEARRITGYTGP